MHRRRKSKSADKELQMFKALYFTPNNPSSFGGKKKFLNAVRRTKGANKNLIKRAEQRLEGVDTYTLHKPTKTGRSKTRRPTVVAGIDSCWQIDLTDLPQYSKKKQ